MNTDRDKNFLRDCAILATSLVCAIVVTIAILYL